MTIRLPLFKDPLLHVPLYSRIVVLFQKISVFNWKMSSINFLKLVVELQLQLVKSLHQLWLFKQIVFLIHHLLSQSDLT